MAGNRRLWTVVPAAGKSERFINAGYTVPKPLLYITDIEGTTLPMLSHVLQNLPGANRLVGLPSGFNYPPMAAYTVPIAKTRGQADTIYQLLELLPAEDSVIISDCDIVVKSHCVQYMLRTQSNLFVTRTDNPAMSYIDDYDDPCIFAEKERISEWGIVGVRYFQNIDVIRQALHKALECIQGEVYISHALNYISEQVKVCQIMPNEYQDWGTPEAVIKSGARIL